MDSKVIVITGASEGIGATLAELLGQQGHKIVVAARRKEPLEAVAARSGDARAVVADVTKRGDVEKLRDAALAAFGHVDVWVNNAGRGILKHVLELDDQDIDDMITVNVKSVVYGAQAIAPHFIERGRGHIVNVSSFLGRIPAAPQRSVYSAAKAAMGSLTANLRGDLRAKAPAIHVTLVMPGLVATDFAKNAVHSVGGLPTQPNPAAATNPALQIQTPEEVAQAIARVIAEPAAELYTNPAHAPVVARYFQDVGAFEAMMSGGPPPAAKPAS